MQKLSRDKRLIDVKNSHADFAKPQETQMETNNLNQGQERLIRLPSTLSMVGIGRSTLYDLISKGRFPPPLKIGRIALWRESEVQQWISELNGVDRK